LPEEAVIGADWFSWSSEGSPSSGRQTLGERAYYWVNFFTADRAPLNTRGPYRFLKNPMYTVGYLPLYGLALFTMSLPGLLAAAFDHVAILAFHRWVEQPHFERWSGAMQPVETSSAQRGDTTTD
jgi:hypothetical protein